VLSYKQAPPEVMDEFETRLSQIPNSLRRTFAGMTIYLDHVMKYMVGNLTKHDMWKSTVLVYVSDNGADPTNTGAGSNWPLRGRKSTLFEGGIKVPAFVYSFLLPLSSQGITYGNMVHATDWLPTLIEGVLGRRDLLASSTIPDSARQRQSLDGVNQWDDILNGGGSYVAKSPPRSEIFVNLDYLNASHFWQGFDTAAIIVAPWKLILNERNETAWPISTQEDTNEHKEGSYEYLFNFLFNLADDPNESTNLIDTYPEKVKSEVEKWLVMFTNV